MFFGGPGGIPFGMDDGMGGGMPGMGGRGGREPPDTTELYKCLGLGKDATQSEIKKAFRKLALKKLHQKIWQQLKRLLQQLLTLSRKRLELTSG